MLTETRLEDVKAELRTNPQMPAVELATIANPTLARLMAEVKNDNGATIGAYDRAHNRHNR